MEHLCKFLSYDLYTILGDLFNSLGNVWCTCLGKPKRNCISLTEVTHPSYTIRHNYPKRLFIYDGEARCEPRLIRLSDLKKSNVTLVQQQCEKKEGKEEDKEEECEQDDEQECEEEDNDEDDEECEDEDKSENDDNSEDKIVQCQPSLPILPNLTKNCQTMEKITPCSSKKAKPDNRKKKVYFDNCITEIPDKKILAQQEQNAKQLYQNWLCCFQKAVENAGRPAWESLKPVQKLRFYWCAYTGDELHGTPYENFCRSFTESYLKAYPNTGSKCLRTEMRRQWWCLDRCQRLPFILEALLYHVSMEAVNLNDHCAVRAMFNRLR